MRHFLLLLFSLTLTTISAQSIFYQDVFKGGICVTGISTSDGVGSSSVPYYIETGSNLRKVFLVTYALSNDIFYPDDFDVLINGVSHNQNKTDNLTIYSPNDLSTTSHPGHHTHISDITNDVILSSGNINIQMNLQNIPTTCSSCRYAAPVLVILYENSTLPKVNISLVVNDGPNSIENELLINNFNPFDSSYDIVMGVHSDRLGGNVNDGYNYFINDQFIGQNNEQDITSLLGGTIGTFYYQNNTLTGLTDDIANNTLNGSDGILLINDYVGSNLNPTNIEYSYIETSNFLHNILVGLYFAYSTPCEPFDITFSSDTTLCKGEALQLSATGGQSYQWQPALGLSCTDCPNPVFTADTTRLYTVRIFNNDSCSVIRPIMIYVKENPVINTLQINPTVCGDTTGMVRVTDPVGMSYSLNGGSFQALNQFLMVPEGNHTIQIKDEFGCVSDTLISVPYEITTIANFSISPQSGAAPLTVVITNTSQNTTNYEWFINGTPFMGNLSSYTFDTSGVYEIQLIAINNFSYCSDTQTMIVNVYDSLMISVPNVFTPNGDGVNDFYTLTANLDVDVEFTILNRWGLEIYTGNVNLTANIPSLLWDGDNQHDGVYFIQMKITHNDGNSIELQEFITLKN